MEALPESDKHWHIAGNDDPTAAHPWNLAGQLVCHEISSWTHTFNQETWKPCLKMSEVPILLGTSCLWLWPSSRVVSLGIMAVAWGQAICEGWRALPRTAIWCWHGAAGGQGQRGVVAGWFTYTRHHRHIMRYDIRINDIRLKYMHRHCLNFHFSRIQGLQGESMWSCQTATPPRSVTSHTRPFRGVYPEYQASLDLSCLISLSSSAPAALSSAGVAIMAYWTPQRHRLIASIRWISMNRSGFYLLGNGHSHVVIQEGFIASDRISYTRRSSRPRIDRIFEDWRLRLGQTDFQIHKVLVGRMGNCRVWRMRRCVCKILSS